MVQDSVRDQAKYFSSFDNIQRISDQGSAYLGTVSKVRDNIKQIKASMVDSNFKVTKKFSL